jgi:2-oxoisovalerate dehydrogenase E1 component
MLRTCVAAAKVDGTVSVFLEPIALYHTRDLHEDGDLGWLSPYAPPRDWALDHAEIGRGRTHGDGLDLTLVTFANGLFLSLRVARRLAEQGIRSRVLDLRWLAPLPVEDLLREAEATGRVWWWTRHAAPRGIGRVLAALVDAGFSGRMARVTSEDSFVPLGDAALTVLLSEQTIEEAARSLVRAKGRAAGE